MWRLVPVRRGFAAYAGAGRSGGAPARVCSSTATPARGSMQRNGQGADSLRFKQPPELRLFRNCMRLCVIRLAWAPVERFSTISADNSSAAQTSSINGSRENGHEISCGLWLMLFLMGTTCCCIAHACRCADTHFGARWIASGFKMETRSSESAKWAIWTQRGKHRCVRNFCCKAAAAR